MLLAPPDGRNMNHRGSWFWPPDGSMTKRRCSHFASKGLLKICPFP